jgi:hypothetical protein
MRNQILATLVGLFGLASALAADSNSDARKMLSLSQMTGACRTMEQMVNFQKTARLPGGDEFIGKFWAAEFARQGITRATFLDECERSLAAYDELWAIAGKGTK